MEFKWHYLGEQPRRLRSVFRSFGVTNSLLKVAIFHGGQMRINNRVAWAIDQVEPGDVVYLVVPNEPANPTITVSDQLFEIAYEDEDFLVINKEAGVATVPAHHVAVQDSLVNRVKGYYQRQNYPNQVTHVATRLDKDTSGLVVFPKHRFAHAVLDRQLKARQVKKEYLAMVQGRLTVSHGYIDAPIRRDPDSFVKRQVAPDGKASATEYWCERVTDTTSLVRVRLHTGRTHQIRVHFSFLGHPLLGDDMYGNGVGMPRQALHCQRVSFYSPFKQKVISVAAPLPTDFQRAEDEWLN